MSQLNGVNLRSNDLNNHLDEFKSDEEKVKEKQLPLSNMPYKSSKGIKSNEGKNNNGSQKGKTTATIDGLIERSEGMMNRIADDNTRFTSILENIASKLLE